MPRSDVRAFFQQQYGKGLLLSLLRVVSKNRVPPYPITSSSVNTSRNAGKRVTDGGQCFQDKEQTYQKEKTVTKNARKLCLPFFPLYEIRSDKEESPLRSYSEHSRHVTNMKLECHNISL